MTKNSIEIIQQDKGLGTTTLGTIKERNIIVYNYQPSPINYNAGLMREHSLWRRSTKDHTTK